MKTKLTLIMFAVFVCLFNSCSDEEKIDKENRKTTLTTKDVGYYHNDILSKYYQNKKNKKAKVVLTVGEIQNEIIDIIKKNHPELLNSINDEALHLPLFVATSKSKERKSADSENIDFFAFLDNALDAHLKEKFISKEFAKNIRSIFVSSQNEDINFLSKELTSYLDNNNLSKNEILFINVFLDTLEASNEYWTNIHNSKTRLSLSSKVMAWDAVGAGLGIYGGPIFSIAQGALVSIAFNEDPMLSKQDLDIIEEQNKIQYGDVIGVYTWDNTAYEKNRTISEQ